MTITRIALVTVSFLACAWFAFGIREVHDQQEAASIINARDTPTAAEAARTRRLLDAAAELNPDRAPDLLRAQLALHVGHHAAAARILVDVVRQEPENIDAWLLLGIATARLDKRTSDRARERVGELAGRRGRSKAVEPGTASPH